jgi:CubicO group peptidase (beta-lactamase class C family)
VKLRCGRPEEVDMSPQRIALVAQLAEGWVRNGIHPSLVVLVARRGVIVLHEAYGRFGPGPESPPLSCDTIFPITSLTKPITATAVMQLVEDGTVGLNRPVQDYVPEFAGTGKEQIMVHHLLTHTSGLNDDDLAAHVATRTGIAPALLPEQTAARPTLQEYLEPRYDGPLSKAPGAEMSYSNMNHALLGEILRRVSGESIAQFARDRIFGPLGMLDTDYVLPDSREHRLIRRPPGIPFPYLGMHRSHTSGAAFGGVTSTALDMAAFGQMFLNRGRYGGAQIISAASVTEMARNQIPGIGATFNGMYYPEASWGYGWGIHGNGKWKYFDGSLHSPRAFHHGGAGGVYLWVDPAYEIVGLYFSVLAHIIPPNDPKWCTDLFVNAVTAAALDT